MGAESPRLRPLLVDNTRGKSPRCIFLLRVHPPPGRAGWRVATSSNAGDSPRPARHSCGRPGTATEAGGICESSSAGESGFDLDFESDSARIILLSRHDHDQRLGR